MRVCVCDCMYVCLYMCKYMVNIDLENVLRIIYFHIKPVIFPIHNNSLYSSRSMEFESQGDRWRRQIEINTEVVVRAGKKVNEWKGHYDMESVPRKTKRKRNMRYRMCKEGRVCVCGGVEGDWEKYKEG